MKKIKEVAKSVEMTTSIVDEEDGLIVLLGKTVLIQCLNYNYTGKLVGVNTNDIKLEDAKVVFETGPYTSPNMKNAEFTHKKVAFIRTSAIESYWEVV